LAWVVDTCVLIDVLEDVPEFGAASARVLDQHAGEGLVVSSVTYAELAPAFEGDLALQDEFLGGVGVLSQEDWTWDDTLRAHAAWHAHTRRRREHRVRKRPLADILVGAFALRFQGLITRNPADFQTDFPDLALRLPSGR
jgi:predicted nucleic acid-binding protein